MSTNACPDLAVHLSCLLSGILIHGNVLHNNRNGNLTDSSNNRGISLSCLCECLI